MNPRIMVVGGSAFSSRAIERAGFGLWSHMAGILSDGTVLDAQDVAIDGIPAGVQLRPKGYLNSQPRWAIFEAPTGDHYAAWEAALRSQLGKPYDERGIEDFAESVFTGSYVDSNYAGANSKAWFCDCLQSWGAMQGGDLPPWPTWFKPFTLTPSSSANLFLGAGWKLTASQGI